MGYSDSFENLARGLPNPRRGWAGQLKWKADPLGEYRWIDLDGLLSKVADAIWIYGDGGRTNSRQLLVPHWKTCLAIIRKWDPEKTGITEVQIVALGPVKTPRWNHAGETSEIIAVRLHPEAVEPIIGLRPLDLVDQDVMVQPRFDFDPVRRRAESGATAEQVALALIQYLAKSRAAIQFPHSKASLAAAFIRQSQGQARISHLAKTLDVPMRSFRRAFEQNVGLAPKHYARNVRLMKFLLRADEFERPNWSAFAQDFGYFDQAHMIQDITSLAGVGPAQLHRSRRYSGGTAP